MKRLFSIFLLLLFCACSSFEGRMAELRQCKAKFDVSDEYDRRIIAKYVREHFEHDYMTNDIEDSELSSFYGRCLFYER